MYRIGVGRPIYAINWDRSTGAHFTAPAGVPAEYVAREEEFKTFRYAGVMTIMLSVDASTYLVYTNGTKLHLLQRYRDQEQVLLAEVNHAG